MIEERKFLKNVGSMAASVLVPAVLNLVILMIVARILLNEGMNQYNIVLNFVAMFALSSDLGITSVLVREVSRDRSKLETLGGSYLALRVTGSLVMGLVAIGIAGFMPYEQAVITYIFIAVLSQVIFQIAQAFAGMFQSVERMEYIAIGTGVQSIVYFGLGLWMVAWMGMGVPGLLYAGIISNLLLLAFYILQARHSLASLWQNIHISRVWFIILSAIPFGAYVVLNLVQTYTGRIILSFLRYDEVANYTMVFTFVMVIAFGMHAYMSSVFPLFSRLAAGGSTNIGYACRLSFKYLIALATPMCVGGALLSERIVYTLYGADFSGAIPVLQVLIFVLAFMVVTTVGLPLINATGRERAVLVGNLVCAVLNIVLNLTLIPVAGAIGAGMASLLTVMVSAGIIWYLIRKELAGINFAGLMLRPLVSSGVMALFIWFIPLDNLFLYVLGGAAVYLLVYAIVGGVTREDIALLKRIIGGDVKL